ncbi:MAG: glutamate--tRNA ligase [Alphaproteobacteria bacterium]|nr:glutamate--tRNA ligase [Alphaproteobacteria bacterium]
MSTIVRFAPSPTGDIHIGNARTALINALFALKTGGQFILRFDDTDTARSTPQFAKNIARDLAWLGIAPHRVEYQSRRTGRYAAARDKLIATGRLYACYETADELTRKRSRARALGRPPIYDRAGLNLSATERETLEKQGRKPHWRFALAGRSIEFVDLVRGPQTVNTATQSDPVLIREDGSYLYTLPSVVDDIEMGVTHVIRGEDHVTNTGAQIELIEALGASAPQFAHHNLLVDESGKALSKRAGSLSLNTLNISGYEPLAVAAVATLTGSSVPPEPVHSLGELSNLFELSRLSRAPARFSLSDLDALNAKMVRQYSYEQVKDRLAAMGIANGAQIWAAMHENISRLNDIAQWAALVNGPVSPVIGDEDREFITIARNALPPEPWDEDTWANWTSKLKTLTGRKGRGLFMPLRLALTGRADGPELKTLLPLVGRKGSLDRLS